MHSFNKTQGGKNSNLQKLAIAFSVLISILFFNCSGNKNEKTKTTEPENKAQSTIEQKVSPQSIIPSAINNDVSQIKELLKNGADVNQNDEGGRTALMFAAFNGLNPIVEELLKHQADVNITDANGRTALMFAASGPFPETVKLLLENGAEIDIQDSEEHFTAFMFAAAEGQFENVKILLGYGANPNLKDIDGDNAQVFAKNNGHTEVVEYLENL